MQTSPTLLERGIQFKPSQWMRRGTFTLCCCLALTQATAVTKEQFLVNGTTVGGEDGTARG